MIESNGNVSKPLVMDTNKKTHEAQKKRDSLSLLESLGDGSGVDVRNVSSDTGSTPNVVQVQTGDKRVGLEQERQGLTDTTTGTENGDLSLSPGGRGKGSSRGSENVGRGSSKHFRVRVCMCFFVGQEKED